MSTKAIKGILAQLVPAQTLSDDPSSMATISKSRPVESAIDRSALSSVEAALRQGMTTLMAGEEVECNAGAYMEATSTTVAFRGQVVGG
jgi:hypothetical protein